MLRVVIKTSQTKPVVYGTVPNGVAALNLSRKLMALGWIVTLIAF